MANHMAEVAKMLNVELGVEFYINESSDFKCTIYNDGLYVYPTRDDVRFLPDDVFVLSCLLKGKMTIMRKPWRPKYTEKYWYVSSDGTTFMCTCGNCTLDMIYYKLGNCYRTQEEAEANRDKWMKFYASDEVLEV